MPPKTEITQERIVQAAVEAARQSGQENSSAGTVSGQLIAGRLERAGNGAVLAAEQEEDHESNP